MHRRRFLAGTGTGFLTVAAGCLALDVPGSDGHPLAGTTQTVRIEDNSDGPHDVEQNARESLEYWEAHSEEFVDFTIGFEVVETDDPDIIITYSDDPRGCENVPEYSERVLGCAPLIREGNRVDRPIHARVVAATRPFAQVRTTTQHEVGHILGLGHDDEPRNIMSNRPEDRIPLYALRVEIWESVVDANERAVTPMALLGHGIDTFARGEYTASAVALETASEDLTALREQIAAAIESTAEFEEIVEDETVVLPLLRDLLGRLQRRFEAAAALAAALATSARAASAGDDDERDAALDTAIRHSDEFNATEPVVFQDIAFALGLVRGTDREEQVVELDEELPEDV